MKTALKVILVAAAVAVSAVSVVGAGDLSMVMDFSHGDARLYTGDGDWAHGEYKGECGQYLNAVGGISSTKAGSCPFLDPTCNPEWTRKLLCISEPFTIDIGRGSALVGFPGYDNRNDLTTGDWAPHLEKRECAANEAVVGVSQKSANTDGNGQILDGIKCAPISNAVGWQNCQALDFHDRSARETTARGDWDYGYYKGECAAGRYVKGVAIEYAPGENPAGARARRLLCCSPRF